MLYYRVWVTYVEALQLFFLSVQVFGCLKMRLP